MCAAYVVTLLVGEFNDGREVCRWALLLYVPTSPATPPAGVPLHPAPPPLKPAAPPPAPSAAHSYFDGAPHGPQFLQPILSRPPRPRSSPPRARRTGLPPFPRPPHLDLEGRSGERSRDRTRPRSTGKSRPQPGPAPLPRLSLWPTRRNTCGSGKQGEG